MPIAVNCPCGKRLRAPDDLLGEALAEWRRIVPLFADKGVLSPGDRGALISYCRAWDHLCEAELGWDAADGTDEKHRANKVLHDAFSRWLRLAERFGLTPADRARVKIPGTGGRDKSKAKFFRPRAVAS